MRSVELFSGCGGLALGLSRAGFEHARMVEWNNDACATLSQNKERGVEHVRAWPFEHKDVRLVDWSKVDGSIDLVAGGPPCQPFSIGGKHKGKHDTRDMWPEAIRAVRELRPRAFLFENVRGLARPAFAEYLEWITRSLAAPSVTARDDESHTEHLARLRRRRTPPDYKLMVLKVNAADYGAPQKRHRVVVVGVRADLLVDLVPPHPTHSQERLIWDKWVTGEYWRRHSIRRPAPTELERSAAERLHAKGGVPSTEAWRTVRDALAGLGEPNGKDWHVFQPGARLYPGHTGSPLDDPAKALKAGDHGVPGGENMMVLKPGVVRYFTVREAARLQGMPDDWTFAGSWTESMRQIGNAVPVQLSETFGRWLVGMLERASNLVRPERAA